MQPFKKVQMPCLLEKKAIEVLQITIDKTIETNDTLNDLITRVNKSCSEI